MLISNTIRHTIKVDSVEEAIFINHLNHRLLALLVKITNKINPIRMENVVKIRAVLDMDKMEAISGRKRDNKLIVVKADSPALSRNRISVYRDRISIISMEIVIHSMEATITIKVRSNMAINEIKVVPSVVSIKGVNKVNISSTINTNRLSRNTKMCNKVNKDVERAEE